MTLKASSLLVFVVVGGLPLLAFANDYGQLTEDFAVTPHSTQISRAGSYVSVASADTDDADDWDLDTNFDPTIKIKVPKSAVRIIPRIFFRHGDLPGVASRDVLLLTDNPDASTRHDTLNQPLQPSKLIRKGEHFYVDGRVGDNYTVHNKLPWGHGYWAGWLPVAAVDVVGAESAEVVLSSAIGPAGVSGDQFPTGTILAIMAGAAAAVLGWTYLRNPVARLIYRIRRAVRSSFIKSTETMARERWPYDRFPFGVTELWTNSAAKAVQDLLEQWPTPPQSEDQRTAREAQFWENKAKHFTIAGADGPELRNKQFIVDQFMAAEAWYLAEYYAATGIYREPFFGPEMLRLRRRVDEARNRARAGDKETRPSRLAEAKAAIERLEEYVTKGKQAFVDKWGGWFFMHIQQAFNLAVDGPPANFGPTTAATPVDHPAAIDLIYRQNE